MAFDPRLTSFDQLDRRVLFAVELVDPISRGLVYHGVRVRAAGMTGRPIVSQSGRFVWLEEGSTWPSAITVEMGRQPYLRHTVGAPPRPQDLNTASADERRVRVMLRPTIAYPIEDGVTAIRGCIFASASPSAPPLAGVRMQLAWRDENGQWSPPLPPAEDIGLDEPPSPREQESDAAGEFLVFVNLRPGSPRPDVDDEGFLAVRLQVTEGRTTPMTRVTADDFPFLPANEDPNDLRRGRVREGRVLARDVRLAWNDLIPV